MAVNQLCGETYRIGYNGFQTVFIFLSCTLSGHLHGKSQRFPEGCPERHRIPEGKHPGDTDRDILVRRYLSDFVRLKQQFFAQLIQIGCLFPGLFFLLQPGAHGGILYVTKDLAALTAVIGHPGIAVGKRNNGALAMVGTERAGNVGLLRKGKVPHGLQSGKGTLFLMGQRPFSGCHSRTDRAHNARIRCTDHLFAGILFQRPQYSVILERTALYNDPVAQRIQILQTDNLGKYIFYNGTAQTGHDIARILAVSLLCDNTAVHKYCTAAAQYGRIFGGKGRLGDLLHRNTQRGGKIFQEGAAAGGAGFVDHNICDDAMIDPDGFHILTADIENKGSVLDVLRRCFGMCYGLDNMAVCRKRPGKQIFTVAGRTYAVDDDLHTGPGVAFQHIQHCLTGYL